MVRALIIGSGSFIPANEVTNNMLGRIMDTSDEWIRERSGVERRYYVDEGTATSDMGLAAAEKALEAAHIDRKELDMIIFATMTPDYFFPGCGGLLQHKLGIPGLPCFDIRQQCAGFLFGLQLADAQIRSGAAQTILLVGAETHTGFMPWSSGNDQFLYGKTDIPPTPEEYAWNTRFRHLAVLFGDGGAAVVIKAAPEGDRGILDSILRTDGKDFDRLYVPGSGFKHRPYIDVEQLRRGDHIPVMDGRYVFKNATLYMTAVIKEVMERNHLAMNDIDMVLMHQANRRICEHVQKFLSIPEQKVIHNIHKYGNTTAATIPLLWDEGVRTGRIKPGDLVLMAAFGAGMNWGAVLVRA